MLIDSIWFTSYPICSICICSLSFVLFVLFIGLLWEWTVALLLQIHNGGNSGLFLATIDIAVASGNIDSIDIAAS